MTSKAVGVYRVTEEFEEELCRYTGASYAVAVDNCSNALFLALKYEKVGGTEISIPCRTYPSVPCEIIHAGAKVAFEKVEGTTISGAYQLKPSCVWDSALRFTHNMYMPGTHMCVSFTGPFKHFRLSKGGAILTDNKDAYEWFKRARCSGRRPCPYHEDDLDMLGWNFYMMPELAARGLLLIRQFYTQIGNEPIHHEDATMSYPDLSQFKIYKQTKETL
jgi:dTDP-4-amino-4,6-dideoxygalactose transaminase